VIRTFLDRCLHAGRQSMRVFACLCSEVVVLSKAERGASQALRPASTGAVSFLR
jgi:hypothetical protein